VSLQSEKCQVISGYNTNTKMTGFLASQPLTMVLFTRFNLIGKRQLYLDSVRAEPPSSSVAAAAVSDSASCSARSPCRRPTRKTFSNDSSVVSDVK